KLRAARYVEDPERLAEVPVRLRDRIELPRLVLAQALVVVLVLALRAAGGDLVRYPEKLLVALRLEGGELRLIGLDSLPHLPHARLHFLAWRPAAAGLVAFGIERLDLSAKIACLSIELQDPVEGRVEAPCSEHVAHLLGVFT